MHPAQCCLIPADKVWTTRRNTLAHTHTILAQVQLLLAFACFQLTYSLPWITLQFRALCEIYYIILTIPLYYKLCSYSNTQCLPYCLEATQSGGASLLPCQPIICLHPMSCVCCKGYINRCLYHCTAKFGVWAHPLVHYLCSDMGRASAPDFMKFVVVTPMGRRGGGSAPIATYLDAKQLRSIRQKNSARQTGVYHSQH